MGLRGIAAHWPYKHGGDMPTSAQTRAQGWITNLVETQRATGSSLEFLENVKVDLFPDEVYLFTPQGDILALPRNSTAVDFAYAVHTDVGNHAVAARVDGRLVPLRSKLVSGQRVEIITAKSASPKPQWLEFVASSKARTSIRQQLKQLEHEDAVQLGHRMLDRAEALASSLERVPTKRMDAFLDRLAQRAEVVLIDHEEQRVGVPAFLESDERSPVCLAVRGEGAPGEGYRVECPTSSTEYTLHIVDLNGTDHYCSVPIKFPERPSLPTALDRRMPKRFHRQPS